MRAAVAAALFLLSSSMAPSLAASLDLTPGRELASRLCAECHDIGDGAKPPRRYAPSFSAIMRDPAVTELSLRVFHRSAKEEMPNFLLTSEQVDDIVAYMLSLRGR
jgi:mono/diheme cytochrome c family protein